MLQRDLFLFFKAQNLFSYIFKRKRQMQARYTLYPEGNTCRITEWVKVYMAKYFTFSLI